MISSRLRVASRGFTGRLLFARDTAFARPKSVRVATSVREYHGTPIQTFPERRRRRFGGAIPSERDDVTTEKAPKHSETRYTKDEFVALAMAQLDKLYDSLQPVLNINPDLITTRGVTEPPEPDSDNDDEEEEKEVVIPGPFVKVDSGPVHGTYTIQMNAPQRRLILESPGSGQFNYMYVNGRWVNEHDGHDMDGLFVRDLIRHIQGVPKL